MVDRPRNHATEAQEARAHSWSGPVASDPPPVPTDLLEWLASVYPPRCYTGGPGESLEAHLQYAGKVALVASLWEAHARQRVERGRGSSADDAELPLDEASWAGLSVITELPAAPANETVMEYLQRLEDAFPPEEV